MCVKHSRLCVCCVSKHDATRRYLLFDMLMTLMDYYGDGPGAVNDRLFAELKSDLWGQMRQAGLLKSAGAGEPAGRQSGLAHMECLHMHTGVEADQLCLHHPSAVEK